MLILPEHNPVVLAKRAATIDRLSGGRLLIGVGVGWLKEEFDVLGVPWENRGLRADEYIQVMRRLWSDDEATFTGIMWVTFGHLRPSGHIMPDMNGDRGTVLPD